jgi:autotransporter-associated beta strand protein
MYRLFTKAPRTALHHHIRFMPASSHSYPRLRRNTILQTILIVAVSILAPMVAHAGSATWDLNPTSGDWNTAANWTPATVPNGTRDIATFGVSNNSDVSISGNTEVNGIILTPGGGCSITVPPDLTFTLGGRGISGGGVSFSLPFGGTGGGELLFTDRATAGNSSIENSGFVSFVNNSTAGSADIENIGVIFFSNRATAGSANILNLTTGFMAFSDSSSAGSANITNYDETFIEFSNTSTAGSATIGPLADIILSGSSKGGTARIEINRLLGNLQGILDITSHNAPGVTIGSIEGTGDVFLGANNLTVGSNNLSTTFSGVIHDAFSGNTGGSLTKIRDGTLILSGANTYTGQTNINGGVLQVDGSISSNTFINNRGTLAGGGTVYGNVTNYGGEVSSGDPLGLPGVLTVSSNYMETPSAGLVIQIAGTDPGQVSILNVVGNANLNGALDPELVNGFVPAIGQSFTFLDYASVTGSFSHIKNPVFDHGTKRWTLVYGPNSASLVVVSNGHNQVSRSLAGF